MYPAMLMLSMVSNRVGFQHGPHFRVQSFQRWPHRQGKREAALVIILQLRPVLEQRQTIPRSAAPLAITPIGLCQV